jgi:DNA-binding PadR family transcriptional regulator
MPLHHAVLALLADKPAHGYELKGSFEQAVGDQWGGLNIGHLYQILDRLTRDGLIESERQPQPIKPDRVVHHLTPAGRAELDRWLAEPSSRVRGYRDDFFLKLMAAVQAGDPGKVAGVLHRQRAHLLRELHALSEAKKQEERPPVDGLLITAAELHIRADLGVIDAAEQAFEADLRARQPGLAARSEAAAERRAPAAAARPAPAAAARSEAAAARPAPAESGAARAEPAAG